LEERGRSKPFPHCGAPPFWAVFIFPSGDQPLVLLHTVERDEGQQDGHGGHIFLILGILAIVLILADLQAACTAEHDEDDADIANGNDDPLTPMADTAKGCHQHAGPEDHFAQIVGAADDAVQARIHKALGVYLLGCVFLQVGSTFQHQSQQHDARADVGGQMGAGIVVQAVEHAADLGDIQQRAGDPDGDLHAEGNGLAVLDLAGHVLFVGAALQLTDGQVAAQPQAVENEQGAAKDGAQGQALAVERQHEDALAGNGKAVAQGNEPHIILKADGADDHGGRKQQPKFNREYHFESPLDLEFFQPGLVEQQRTCHQAKLGYTVDALFGPVDPGLGGILTGHEAHAHGAKEGKDEQRHDPALFHFGSHQAKPGAQAAQPHHHHGDEGHAADKGHGSNGQRAPGSDQHKDEGSAQQQKSQGIHRQEHLLQRLEIAEVGGVQQLPQRLE